MCDAIEATLQNAQPLILIAEYCVSLDAEVSFAFLGIRDTFLHLI